eukprot:1140862-Pelagomonas_calceolata.AAC.5
MDAAHLRVNLPADGWFSCARFSLLAWSQECTFLSLRILCCCCRGVQDLDDQMDAAEEELRFLEDELAAAERASQRGDGSAALELRRRIAGECRHCNMGELQLEAALRALMLWWQGLE